MAARRLLWAWWRAGEGRVAGERCSGWVESVVGGALEAMADSSAHAAMTCWMFVVMRVESWSSWCASARVWVGCEVDIAFAEIMLLTSSE